MVPCPMTVFVVWSRNVTFRPVSVTPACGLETCTVKVTFVPGATVTDEEPLT